MAASANKTAGAVPMTIHFSSEGTKDFDNDSLLYEWRVVDQQGKTVTTVKVPAMDYQFKAAGNYKVKLSVTDSHGLADSKEFSIKAGNEPPVVSLNIANANRSFFFPGKKIAYDVKVFDKEDGSLDDKQILASKVKVDFYYQDGQSIVQQVGGHQEAPAVFITGKALMEKSDCKACHFPDKKSIGPSYLDIATKYKSNKNAVNLLSDKIIKGGSGVWGDVPMAPHPAIGLPEAKQITQYILSLADAKKPVSTLPIKGEVSPAPPDGVDQTKGVYKLTASYTDKGFAGIAPITSLSSITLRSPSLQFGDADEASPTIMKAKLGENNLLIVTSPNTYARFRELDLTGIKAINIMVAAPVEQLNSTGGTIEIRSGSPEGALLGQTEFIKPNSDPGLFTGKSAPPNYRVPINPTNQIQDLFFVFKSEKTTGALFIPLSVTFEPE